MEDLKNTIQNVSERISYFKDKVATEEATKQTFVLPIIAALGYNIFDPTVVVPEMDCDITRARGEKIDYAIMKGDKPILIIECKSCKSNLDLHESRLQRYFVASKARFGALTNGIEWRFYTDLNDRNIMDKEPFFVIDMRHSSDQDVNELYLFSASQFDESKLLEEANRQHMFASIRKAIAKNFKNPSPEFVRAILRETHSNTDKKLVAQYTPVVKQVIAEYLCKDIAPNDTLGSKSEKETATGIAKRTASQEEMDAYEIVYGILNTADSRILSMVEDRVSYTVNKADFAINLNGSQWFWICRFKLTPYTKRITIPLDITYSKKEAINLTSIEDIPLYKDKLLAALDVAVKAVDHSNANHPNSKD